MFFTVTVLWSPNCQKPGPSGCSLSRELEDTELASRGRRRRGGPARLSATVLKAPGPDNQTLAKAASMSAIAETSAVRRSLGYGVPGQSAGAAVAATVSADTDFGSMEFFGQRDGASDIAEDAEAEEEHYIPPVILAADLVIGLCVQGVFHTKDQRKISSWYDGKIQSRTEGNISVRYDNGTNKVPKDDKTHNSSELRHHPAC